MEQTVLTAVSAVGFPIVVTILFADAVPKLDGQIHGAARGTRQGTAEAVKGKILKENTPTKISLSVCVDSDIFLIIHFKINPEMVFYNIFK